MNTATQTVVDFEINSAASMREAPASIYLELNVTDPDSVKEVAVRTAGRERDEYALGALRIGLLSLKHARGQVDADAVRVEVVRGVTPRLRMGSQVVRIRAAVVVVRL